MLKYYEIFHEEFNIPSVKALKLVSFIASRQVNSIQNTFSNLDSAANVFFNKHKNKDLYNSIFKFIENRFDFNNSAVQELLREQLSLHKGIDEVEVMDDVSLQEKISKVFFKLTDGSSYSLNPSFVKFINQIENAGENGLHACEVYGTVFHKTNIEYKETQNSYWKNVNNSPKTSAHNELMKVLNLYSFKYGQNSVFTSKMLHDNLDSYLENKIKIKV